MTEKKGKRAVIISDIRSDSIEQAIFILKPQNNKSTQEVGGGIVAEAQEIINSYIKRVERANPLVNKRKKRQRICAFLSAAVTIVSLCVVLTIYLTLHG